MIFGPGGGGGWSDLSATPPDGHPAQLYNLADDLAESQNLYAEEPQIAQQMTALLQQLVARGRSTPGPTQENDVPVKWRKFLKPATRDAQ